MCEIEKLLIKQRTVFAGITSENGRTFLDVCQQFFVKKSRIFFRGTGTCEEGKCYKMKVKSRGENVVLEISESL